MPPRISSRAWKPLLYASPIAVGGSTFYLSSGPQKTPSSDSSIIRRIKTTKEGILIPPKFPAVKSREEQITDLKRIGSATLRSQSSSTGKNSLTSTEDVYDLLIIGGGATGTGIALDAATRGLKVALVEREDFSSGTSSKSTKLVHGGVRYLEKAVWNLDWSQYTLVKEALRERKNFLYTAPHLSSWLPVMLPLRSWWEAPYYWAGAKFYDFLAGSEGLESSYYLTKRKALDAFPMLKNEGLFGALVYYDGQHNDSRMNVSLAMTAALYGATVVNHLEVTSLEKDKNGKLCGARVRDLIRTKDGEKGESEDFLVRAKGIINATGPFADAISQMDEPKKRNMVAPSLGVHVVLPGYLSPKKMGLLDPSTSDGRVIFFLPWQGGTIAGTTDTPCSISKNPVASEEDISWILNEIRGYLTPDVNIQRSDILAAWSGIRPLLRDPNATNTESLVRNHLVTVSASGLLTCAGGKWTTYRQMAEDAVDEAIQVFNLQPRRLANAVDMSGNGVNDAKHLDGTCQTDRLRLIGAHGYSRILPLNLIQHFGLEPEVAEYLAQNYGDRAWSVAALASPLTDADAAHYPFHGQKISPAYPFIDGEIRYAVQCEYAQTAVDVLARRTRLSFLNAQAALEALPVVVDLMGEQLSWSSERKELEWTETVKFLESMGLPPAMLEVTREEVLRGEHRALARAMLVRKEEGEVRPVTDEVRPIEAEMPVAVVAA